MSSLASRLPRPLLAVASAALCSVSLISCQPASESPESSTPTPQVEPVKSGSPTLHDTISKSSLVRDYQNARLSFVLSYKNTSDETVYLSPPFLRLVTPSGEDVAPFMRPSDRVQEIRAGETGVVLLKYWLEAKHLESALTLHLGEHEKIEIKTAKAFDLNALENGKEHELSSVNW